MILKRRFIRYLGFQTAETFCEEAANQQLKYMMYQNQLVVNELTQPKFKTEEFLDPVV